MNRRIDGFLIGGIFAVTLTSCAPNDPVAEKADAGRVISPIPGDRAGKPEAPIDFSYSLAAKPRIGEEVELQITCSPQRQAEDVEITFSSSEGLDLYAARTTETVDLIQAGETFERTITVVPQTEGLLYVNVHASLFMDGRMQARAISIPVVVGDGSVRQLKPEFPVQVDETGEKIISLPAIESTGKP